MQPTAPELEILKLLWHTQPRTARELHDEIKQILSWSYSSTRKTLERMGEKDFVSMEFKGNKKIYFARINKVKTLAAFAQDFAKRVFELDGPLPVAMFTDSRLIDDSEIADLEKLLKDLEQKHEEE
ncbi:BlaI/MecI/CopY family transcriptional regulator [Pseudoalteromonas denitrificans]|uniref:Predicted transcriptional regulator n=1 Tax=Pseudoalteromonas denitrificans DSM 6059 TaxID=1123010 RepID=A0A1I1IIC4_9GAMM|nr:BlaI/MecI/CopY family transcriptional regulator [Pseudoalteromonas denitrificans]SFC36034.1 Predicted transcriptional regulator [Pseudoalteromonas denitrificans DSM 6059]